MSFETEVIEYREGSSKVYSKSKQPGMTKYSDVTLKRGVFLGDFEMYQWWKNTVFFQEGAGKFRRDIVIKLLDEEHNPVITWALQKAWPVKVLYGDLHADASHILVESMTLTHEGLTIVESK